MKSYPSWSFAGNKRSFFLCQSLLIAAWFTGVFRAKVYFFTNEILTGDKRVQIDVLCTRDPIFFTFSPLTIIGGGSTFYDVKIRNNTMDEIKLTSNAEPSGVWHKDGKWYMACREWDVWLIYCYENGKQRILPNTEWPPDVISANLRPVDQQAENKESFTRYRNR